MRHGGLSIGGLLGGLSACTAIGALGLLLSRAEAIRAPAMPPRPTAVPGPLAQHPIAFFEARCAKCHGTYGSTYIENFYADPDPVRLRNVVKYMCEGPGESPLSGRDLEAQAALAVSMATRSVFVAWTDAQGRTISGEATPGAAVTIECEGGPIPARIDGFRWSATLPREGAPFTARAERAGKAATLRAPAESFAPKVE